MIRGGKFYAIWDASNQEWCTDPFRAMAIIDSYIYETVEKHKNDIPNPVLLTLRDNDSGQANKWKTFCEQTMPDVYVPLDKKLIFANDPILKENYATKRLSYSIQKMETPGYDRLTSVTYSPEERRKFEYAIGSVLTGEASNIQKMYVFYGKAGTGKSTVLNIMQALFDGYWAPFQASKLASKNNQFALEDFKDNPLVGIQHDGDLSHVEDNTLLNSLVSHETMLVNEKYHSPYPMKFDVTLFMGTNSEVKITDSKSGLLRRLIDIYPTGDRLSAKEYNKCVKKIKFELGGIAQHCIDVYNSDKHAYDNYKPIKMMAASNDMYNFVESQYFLFKNEDSVPLKVAWLAYKEFLNEANIPYGVKKPKFKEELKYYFKDFVNERRLPDGSHERNVYVGFKTTIFNGESDNTEVVEEIGDDNWLKFDDIPSLFDDLAASYPAQYASSKGGPVKSWNDCNTTLNQIDTSKLHYVKVPINHIVIDFDIPDENGNKSLERNLEEANKLPRTYAELSKSGGGIHLHYLYTGDVDKLSRYLDEHVEIKVFVGGSALRRKKTLCNDVPISVLSSGLPLREVKKIINRKAIKNEKKLKEMIIKNINKDYMHFTKPSINFIHKLLEDAYESGTVYDLSDMKSDLLSFAASSSNNREYCIKTVNSMKLKSEETGDSVSDVEGLYFFDVEVFPNLFLICYKKRGTNEPIVRLYNPTRDQAEFVMRHMLIGYNCRRYDNHMVYACAQGYNNKALYDLSQRIINGDKNAFFSTAYDVSYTDIYDFASASNKMSLKKLEIKMDIHHLELGLPWDKPVPEELWPKVGDYCDNDVSATEAAFDYLAEDFAARQALADISGCTCNDTTNTCTTRFIFGSNRNPQSEFCYRDLSKPVLYLDPDVENFLKMACPEMMSQRHGEAESLLPYFPGYTYVNGKSTYKGKEAGEGGYVDAVWGIHGNVALLDVASMHPHSTIAECLFGPYYTKRFKETVDGRILIKHEDWDRINTVLDGALESQVTKIKDGVITSKGLANALKTAINSVYGLTSAGFVNPFKDPRNVDNIVAKRGALFMIDLQEAVKERGFTVAHIKTDSIKIPDATPEIIKFVMDFGLKYGYKFEHEATYEKMCLVNNAVYIAKYKTAEACMDMYGYVPEKNEKYPGEWTATGTQFAVPYVFKTLFSHEPIVFKDYCEVKSVKTEMYIDYMEGRPDVSSEEKTLKKLLKEGGSEAAVSELENIIATGHNYHYVGKVGEFCPMLPGCGAGKLVRSTSPGMASKYASVTGTKDYLWKESEIVRQLGQEEYIDKSYYRKLVDEAYDAIKQHGDPEWFLHGDYDYEAYLLYGGPKSDDGEPLPFY